MKKRFAQFAPVIQARMQAFADSFFGYGLPLDDSWVDEMGQFEAALLKEFSHLLTEDDDLSQLVDDLVCKV